MDNDSLTDPPRWPGSREADEATALRAVAEVVRRDPVPPIDTQLVRRQVAAVLGSVAQELHHGRAVPVGVRRAALGLANALQLTLDPTEHVDT
jgi:hypothetical protein